MTVLQDTDRQGFLRQLRQSRLLSLAEFQEAARCLPGEKRGRALAEELVRQGVLTAFQAARLLAGRIRGFHLGHYRILDLLGRGGMGRVFKAEHRLLGRVVALKVLSSRLFASSRARRFFRREVRALAQLVHPHIVTALDAGKQGQRCFLVMDYVNGPDLDQLVRRHGPLPVGQACEILRQAAEGLDHAAGKGLVHRDIKPANLLLQYRSGSSAARMVKISDFGLVRFHDPACRAEDDGLSLVGEDTILGTPDYIAPEQARNVHQADSRSDLYSLGCTFYFLLTGSPPFPGGGALDKMIRHATEEPAAIEPLRPDVPPAVAAILRRLLAKNPADRFPSGAALAAALAPFCDRHFHSWKGPQPPGPADALADRTEENDPERSGDERRRNALAETVCPGDPSTPLALSRSCSLPEMPTLLYPCPSRRWRRIFLAAAGLLSRLLTK